MESQSLLNQYYFGGQENIEKWKSILKHNEEISFGIGSPNYEVRSAGLDNFLKEVFESSSF